MLESAATFLITLAVLVMGLALPFRDAFGDQLRRFAAQLVIAGVGAAVLACFVARIGGISVFLFLLLAIPAAYVVVELRLRIGHAPRSAQYTNYRRTGKTPVGSMSAGAEPDEVNEQGERWT